MKDNGSLPCVVRSPHSLTLTPLHFVSLCSCFVHLALLISLSEVNVENKRQGKGNTNKEGNKQERR